ncbi:MAG: RNA polymerase sigma factor [Blautia sp.]|nr:RNA polymerase sigma factor [Lachnoclostridium sp.]MCM1211636.1 RNA polymerase sigma factor [Blautia sp.]
MQQDFLLVRKMQNGDDEAMDVFVRKYYPQILQYCRYHCVDRDSAQDMTQEVFERFFRNLVSYRQNGKALQYLYTIARNLCIDQTRKKREIPVADMEGMEAGGRLGSAGAGECLGTARVEAGEYLGTARVEEKVVIEAALERLPGELREIVILHYFQELGLKEAAKILQISLPLAKYRIRRAREMLGEWLR